MIRIHVISLLLLSYTAYSQCSTIDQKGCERYIYKIDAKNNASEIAIDSCGKKLDGIFFKYNLLNQCTEVYSKTFKSKLQYGLNKDLIKTTIDNSGTKIQNSFLYHLNGTLRSITSRVDMMGFKFESKTNLIYEKTKLRSIEVLDNLNNEKILFLDSIEYYPNTAKNHLDKNSQAVKNFSLGLYTGAGAYASILEGLGGDVKSYISIEPEVCESPIWVQYVYNRIDPSRLVIEKTKICEGKKTSEIHVITSDCK